MPSIPTHGEIVDPALKANTPVFEYESKTWGPTEVAQVTPPDGWQDPAMNEQLVCA